jgi:energy-coupling factor transport system ATP-binding protein
MHGAVGLQRGRPTAHGAERGALKVEIRLYGLVWRRAGRKLLDIDALHVPGPGLVLLAGASGSGKSSLLKALTGTLQEFQGGHTEGRIEHRLDDRPHRVRIGYAPQDPIDGLLGHDPDTEFRLRLMAAGWSGDAAAAEATRRLHDILLQGREHVPVAQLSGGERKRLALRAALVHEPHVLLLDEPLNQVDDAWRPLLLEDVLAAAEKSLVVVSTHDVDDWRPICREIVVLKEGRVAWQGDPTVFQNIRGRFPEIREPTPDPHYPMPIKGDGERLVAQDLAAHKGRPLFRDVSLRLGNGIHAITGPNGSGKTTLLRILGGLEKPAEGRVRFGTHEMDALRPAERARFTAVHLEQPSRIFFLPTVEEELRFQPANAGVAPIEQETRARLAANRFRLESLLQRHPVALSGGEQERVALGCIDAAQPELILLDEPSQGLDGHGWNDLLDFLERWRRQACVLLCTHEKDLIRIADTVHRIEDARLQPVRIGSQSAIVGVVRRSPS